MLPVLLSLRTNDSRNSGLGRPYTIRLPVHVLVPSSAVLTVLLFTAWCPTMQAPPGSAPPELGPGGATTAQYHCRQRTAKYADTSRPSLVRATAGYGLMLMLALTAVTAF